MTKSVASWPAYPVGEVGFHARVFGKLHFESGGHQNWSGSMHDSSWWGMVSCTTAREDTQSETLEK